MATRLQPAPQDGFVPREGETAPNRSGGSGTATAPRSSDSGRGAAQTIAEIASLAAHPVRERRARATVEARWYPPGSGASPPASKIAPASKIDVSRVVYGLQDSVPRKSAGAADRVCAIATMIVAAGLAVAVSIVVAPQLLNLPAPAYPENGALVLQGGEVYGTACAGCHGPDLRGAVAPAPGLAPPLDASGHAWLHSDAALFRIVKYGTTNCPEGAASPRMPTFGDRLDDRSIHAVLAFIKSRWPSEMQVVQRAFNDGRSEAAETQSAVLCKSACRPPEPAVSGAAGSPLAAR